MTNPRSKDYDRIYNECSIPVLAQIMASKPEAGDDYKLYRLVYEQKVIEKQFEHNEKQIKSQAETNKNFLIITVCATIGAAILGAVVGGTVQFYTQLHCCPIVSKVAPVETKPLFSAG